MKLGFKMNYLKQIYHRYHKSNAAAKTAIINEFCKICNYNRKYAIRKLNLPLPDVNPLTKKRNRPSMYSKETISFLEIIWKATGYISSTRLKSAIPLWLPFLKKKYHTSDTTSNKLLAISPSTIDRRLKSKKSQLKHKIYGSTKPGLLLKHQIPIKTDSWNINTPGFLEIDLVSHSGNSASGDFIYSCNATDIFSTWTFTSAIMGKSQIATLNAISSIQKLIPFKIKGIDSDNGSEFINHHLLNFCISNKIQFTRSRPYKKDDNAHIEQKNWTAVRKLLGYLRYDSQQALNLINDIYSNELNLIQNLFLPSQKLLSKSKIGSKYKKIYDNPLTPLQRLCSSNSKNINIPLLNHYISLANSLNPFELSSSLDRKLRLLFKLANKSKIHNSANDD